MTWQDIIVFAETAIFVPLYSLIVLAILKQRKKSANFRNHHYTLVLSQASVDFFAIVFIIGTSISRLFLTQSDLIVPIYASSAAFFFFHRLFGVVLITFQRYSTVCYWSSELTHKLHYYHPIRLILFHWVLSMIVFYIALVVSGVSKTNFVSLDTFFVVLSETNFTKFSIASFVVLCPFIIFMYLQMFRSIRSKNHTQFTRQAQKNQERRIFFHVFFLTTISFLIFLQQVFEALTVNSVPTETINFILQLHPIINADFSFISPLVLIILNSDIRAAVRRLVCLKRTTVVHVSSQRPTVTTIF